jgi:hypothetical protein
MLCFEDKAVGVDLIEFYLTFCFNLR